MNPRARLEADAGASLEPPLERFTVSRRLVAEALGTALLLAAVIGSGIMGERLSGGNVALALFAEPVLQVSAKLREGPAQAWSEFVATFGLLATIFGTLRFRPAITPAAVGLYITAAYWFTASTSFANPAVTLARSLSNTFAGIAPASAPAFIAAQLAGALAATAAMAWLTRSGSQ